MHFRIRQKVVQLIRTVYDPATKKPKAIVVGRVSLDKPEIGNELRSQLSAVEIKEAEAWINNHHRAMSLREEFAAFTLVTSLEQAEAWLVKNKGAPAALSIAASLVPVLHSFRKTLKETGLI